jgi:3-hydroxymyristoyl/3-hydroxydecanoyl-(acyl carrier protein) dehydratase
VTHRPEDILPHRPPFLWLDRVVEVRTGHCVAAKRLDPADPVFAGHFPGNPVMPGVLLIEAAAQTAGVMLGAGLAEPPAVALLAAVNHFKFVERVKPGDTIEVETTLKLEALGMAVVAATIRVDGQVVASGEISVASR